MPITEKGPNIDITVLAGEAMADSDRIDTDYKYRVVCLNSDKEVVYPTAITDVPFGVLIKGDLEGYPVKVRMFGVCPIKVIGAMTVPTIIGIGNDNATVDGRVEAAVATVYPIGQILEASDAEDDIISAIINCINPVVKA